MATASNTAILSPVQKEFSFIVNGGKFVFSFTFGLVIYWKQVQNLCGIRLYLFSLFLLSDVDGTRCWHEDQQAVTIFTPQLLFSANLSRATD